MPPKDISVSSILQARRGGFASQGDRSAPHTQSDVFQGLRQRFFRLITDLRMDKQILSAFESKAEQEPFSSEQLQPFRRLVDEFLEAHGITPDWSVPSGQCIWLHLLQQLSSCMNDPDTALFPYLIEGVPIGNDVPIAPSKCFPLQSPPRITTSFGCASHQLVIS
jgi:hypothetical protein